MVEAKFSRTGTQLCNYELSLTPKADAGTIGWFAHVCSHCLLHSGLTDEYNQLICKCKTASQPDEANFVANITFESPFHRLANNDPNVSDSALCKMVNVSVLNGDQGEIIVEHRMQELKNEFKVYMPYNNEDNLFLLNQ